MQIVNSSEKYMIRTDDLISLEDSEDYFLSERVVILLGDAEKSIKDKLLSGRDILEKSKLENLKYVEVIISYYSCSYFKAFFLNLVKNLKRKFYVKGTEIYHIDLNHIYSLELMRGYRDFANAYAWTNKKWAMLEEERQAKYLELYNSIKENGYDESQPIDILLNRNFGISDQIYQGHHRLSICKDLNILEATAVFYSAPKNHSSLECVSLFLYKIKKIFNI